MARQVYQELFDMLSTPGKTARDTFKELTEDFVPVLKKALKEVQSKSEDRSAMEQLTSKYGSHLFIISSIETNSDLFKKVLEAIKPEPPKPVANSTVFKFFGKK